MMSSYFGNLRSRFGTKLLSASYFAFSMCLFSSFNYAIASDVGSAGFDIDKAYKKLKEDYQIDVKFDEGSPLEVKNIITDPKEEITDEWSDDDDLVDETDIVPVIGEKIDNIRMSGSFRDDFAFLSLEFCRGSTSWCIKFHDKEERINTIKYNEEYLEFFAGSESRFKITSDKEAGEDKIQQIGKLLEKARDEPSTKKKFPIKVEYVECSQQTKARFAKNAERLEAERTRLDWLVRHTQAKARGVNERKEFLKLRRQQEEERKLREQELKRQEEKRLEERRQKAEAEKQRLEEQRRKEEEQRLKEEKEEQRRKEADEQARLEREKEAAIEQDLQRQEKEKRIRKSRIAWFKKHGYWKRAEAKLEKALENNERVLVSYKNNIGHYDIRAIRMNEAETNDFLYREAGLANIEDVKHKREWAEDPSALGCENRWLHGYKNLCMTKKFERLIKKSVEKEPYNGKDHKFKEVLKGMIKLWITSKQQLTTWWNDSLEKIRGYQWEERKKFEDNKELVFKIVKLLAVKVYKPHVKIN